MSPKIPRFSILFAIFVLSLLVVAGAVSAQDGSKDDGGNQAQVESQDNAQPADGAEEATEPAETEEVEEEETPEVTYLDDAVRSEGSVGVVFKLDAGGEDSPFFGRYHDPFEGDSVFINDIRYRGWETEGSILRFDLSDTWDPSWRAGVEWGSPRELWFHLTNNDYRYFEIPTTDPANRHDFNLGFEAYGNHSHSYGLEYTYRENTVMYPGRDMLVSDWESGNAELRYGFQWADWTGSLEYRQRSYDRTGDLNDVDHAGGTFRIGRTFADADYIEGNLAYNVSKVSNGDDLEAWKIGAYGRFVDALGVDNFNVTSHVGWMNRTEGPSRLHPAGDSFEFDIEGRLRADRNLWLYGSWEYGSAETTHADQPTNIRFYNDPDPFVVGSRRLLEETVSTNAYNLGGRWRVSDGLDFTVDLNWLERGDLPTTDLVGAGSPTLWWESETHHTYALRYRTGPGMASCGGDWLLKYETIGKENDARATDSSVEHLSINWNGILNPSFLLYVGGGFLRTDNSLGGVEQIDQEGTEYGGGWSWALEEDWDFYGDYWVYDVGGTWGYQQTTFGAGLGYEVGPNWKWSLEYKTVDGNFDDRPNLDYKVEDLLLGLSYHW